MSKCDNCKEEHKNDNVGCLNSGNWNSGNWNSGNWNSGNWNSGNWNSGNWNSGNWNSGNWNSGYFNTTTPDKVRIFDAWVEMTHDEFNEKYDIYADLPLNRWVEPSDMTAEEKKAVKGWEQMGGYLKTLPFKEACQVWWNENPTRHQDFLSLPNFNPEKFKTITGIDVSTPSLAGQEVEVKIGGKTYKAVIKDA